MHPILDGISAAFRLLFSGDAELWGSTGRTLAISGSATVLAALAGIPAGVAVGLSRARSRRILVAALYAGMGLPTVLVGLLLTVLLWREGPLGSLGLLYTPAAMVMGQVVIAFPVVGGLTVSAIDAIAPRVRRQVEALGATRLQAARLLAIEARRGIVVATLAGFGHALSEVGAAMMLGGNLAGSTRVLTTATVLAARMGQFDLAIGLALLLFTIALVVNGGAVALSTSRDP
jgi:tungstate transport system permease protein